MELLLYGRAEGGSGTMPAGSHQFPFHFQLPPVCPTSYEGRWGSIRYSCMATIDKPWKFNHRTRRVLTIVGYHDLNRDSCAPLPFIDEKEERIGPCCCPAGTISASLRLHKTGYVPGESLQLSIDVTNNSSSSIKRVKIEARPHSAQFLGSICEGILAL